MAKIKSLNPVKKVRLTTLREPNVMPHKQVRLPQEWLDKLKEICDELSTIEKRVTFSELVREAVKRTWIK